MEREFFEASSASQVQESRHLLAASDLLRTIKSQQFAIQQLKLENQFLKKRLVNMAKGEVI